MQDLFHQTKDGKLDRQYLRTCATYKLLMRRKSIDKTRAIELLHGVGIKCAKATVEIWLQWPPQPREAA
jgi:ABC-type antimicrobial peptide transport system ATPase subunit